MDPKNNTTPTNEVENTSLNSGTEHSSSSEATLESNEESKDENPEG